MTTVLITGANGLLGQHLVQQLLWLTDWDIIATGMGPQRWQHSDARLQYLPLDITDGMAVHSLMHQYQPQIVLHAAAITQIDDCETNPIRCWEVNVTATRFLLDAAAGVGAYFLFLSTDFVFDGQQGNYKETDVLNPVSYYGSSKVAGERAVMAAELPACIVRTCLVYGNILAGTRSNIISWVKQSLESNTPIKVVDDQWRTPTYVADLAKGIITLVAARCTGIFHVSGEEGMSPYQMAIATAKYLQLDESLITRVTAATFTQPAQRPMKTGFDISKVKQTIAYQPVSFQEGLGLMLGI